MKRLSELAFDLRPYLLSVAEGVSSQNINRIILLHPGAVAAFYDVTDIGLAAALAAAVSGDAVILPACAITGGPWSVGAGVTLFGTWASELTGNVTLASGASAEGFAVVGKVTLNTATARGLHVTIVGGAKSGNIATDLSNAVNNPGIELAGGVCLVSGCRVTHSGVACGILAGDPSESNIDDCVSRGTGTVGIHVYAANVVTGGYYAGDVGVRADAGLFIGVYCAGGKYGVYRAVAFGTNAYMIGCFFNGITYDIYDGSLSYLSLYACQYETTYEVNAGRFILMQGDRASYLLSSGHSPDIDTGILTRHLPLPGSAGQIAISSGSSWGGALVSGDATLSSLGALTLAAGAVTLPKLASGSAQSVLGVSGSAAGTPGWIQASADGQVLRRSGTAIGFGAINLASGSAVSGILPAANGGTGGSAGAVAGSIAPGQIGYGSAGSALTSGSVLQFDGTNFGIGIAPSATYKSRILNSLTDIAGTRYALFALGEYIFTSSNTQQAKALASDLQIAPAVGVTLATANRYYSLETVARNTGAGTISYLYGQRVTLVQSGGGNITNAYSKYIQLPSVTSGSIANHYGLYIEALTAGSASNYSIYTNAGRVSMGDTLELRGLSGAAGQLQVSNGTPPSAGVANAAVLYSDDLAAGNAWLHTRGEAGAGLPLTAGSGAAGQLAVWASGSAVLGQITTYERHVQIPAFLSGTPANQPTQVDFGTAGGLQFPTTGTKYSFCQWEIPDDWNGGDAYIEVDWFPDSGAMGAGDVIKWALEYRSIAEGELITNGSSVSTSGSFGGVFAQYATKHTRMTLPATTGNQPLAKQDHMYFKISRDTAVAGDFGGSVTVPAFEIIYNSTGLPTSN